MNYSGINILWDKERICRHMDFNKQTKFKNADFDVPELRALNINTCSKFNADTLLTFIHQVGQLWLQNEISWNF